MNKIKKFFDQELNSIKQRVTIYEKSDWSGLDKSQIEPRIEDGRKLLGDLSVLNTKCLQMAAEDGYGELAYEEQHGYWKDIGVDFMVLRKLQRSVEDVICRQGGVFGALSIFYED